MKNILVLLLMIMHISDAAAQIKLPPPDPSKSAVKSSEVIGWPKGKKPTAPAGFKVEAFATGLSTPRWIYVAPNGDVLVSQVGDSDEVTLFRDKNKDGKYEIKNSFLSGVRRPFGMLILKDSFYVANESSLWKYPYKDGDISIKGPGKKILDLPRGGHWTRNIIANKEGTKIYIAVGSRSNIGEAGMDSEKRRANILEIDPDGQDERVFASGLRNPVGMAWHPVTGALWTAVNERDGLGDDLVPDFITHVVDGGFYGWPYTYFGAYQDPRVKVPADLKPALVPDIATGAHTASLGLAFYDKKKFPAKYRNGAFVGLHGSWNRSEFAGYKVAFVSSAGKLEDFLTGFIENKKKGTVYGRPVGVTVLPDGSLLVADDAGNAIWKVSYTGK